LDHRRRNTPDRGSEAHPGCLRNLNLSMTHRICADPFVNDCKKSWKEIHIIHYLSDSSWNFSRERFQKDWMSIYRYLNAQGFEHSLINLLPSGILHRRGIIPKLHGWLKGTDDIFRGGRLGHIHLPRGIHAI
jgi:hypothetical protein